MSSEVSGLDQLFTSDQFLARHIGVNDGDISAMLDLLGLETLESIGHQAVPSKLLNENLDLLDPRNEDAVLAELRQMADENVVLTSLIGMGYYGTITPPVIVRNVIENPAWYTAYTPYQPEIAQGRLEALLNFQTMVADLTGGDLANASLLDEATAAAEAMTLLARVGQGEVFFVDADTHPQTIAVIQTRAEPLGIPVIVGDAETEMPRQGVFGVLIQEPGTSGKITDRSDLIKRAHEQNTLVAIATDLLALVLVKSPGEQGADVIVGSSQRFGVPLGFGGPHAGFMATRDEYKRNLPGRLVGVSLDDAGRPALRLALQTREQHIRREKATSNICTAQVLLAVVAGMYGVYHGAEGLRDIALRVHRLTSVLASGLSASFTIAHNDFFDTVQVKVPDQAQAFAQKAVERGYNLRVVDGDTVSISLDEKTDRKVIEDLWEVFGVTVSDIKALETNAIPPELVRTSAILTHPVFSQYRSETEMLRYLRRLSDRDLALDRTMIPLGSCTMKLNATVEMIPITWPGFCDIHPFAPIDQVGGYLKLFSDLERWLCEITGYDAVSLQPNAGSQGELAGLLAIRAFHRSQGDDHRTICLIPESAHGTNAASAIMAGMTVVVIACDESGNVDVVDLESRVEEFSSQLAALMVTYPSTHGVFEEQITNICETIHRHGGQVYLDGANLNALVGLAKPGLFGADVSHLNLHKTFCIPHGGGGPGVGPVAVRSHLAPFLPNHPLRPEAGPSTGIGAIAAAPWGSAGILPISWAYIALMGAKGLQRATRVAILSANYVAERLEHSFPVLYRGAHDRVAHECVLDLRPITAATGVTAEDVAKRLIDYGFHAPTMSWPVAGTLMVEPTESESRVELDRFCDAMIAIRSEISQIEKGEWSVQDSPLRHAPHIAIEVAGDTWDRPYSRSRGAFPAGREGDKYWPPVGRIDNVHGDRNVFCSCPPLVVDR